MQSFFVSSTFRDMQGERDSLHRTVMPRLREQAVKNGDNIQFVDLRWGIATADMDSTESTSRILSVCLREVQSCKPYMIVLLGQRYGWIPPVEQIREAGAQLDFAPEDMNISVTELEIRFGMYLAQGQLDRCVFCLREPMEEAALTPAQREVYLPANDADARRMAALREKIQNTPGAHVITYRLECEDGRLTGYEDFSEKLYAALEGLLAPRWEARKGLRWQMRQNEENYIISESHLRSFVGRGDTLRRVTDTVRGTQVVTLEGEGGCGKSALMAKLNQMYNQADYHSIVLYCGATPGCMTVKQVMRMMIWMLEVLQVKVGPDVPDEKLQEHFRERMKNYEGPVCLFFLDAIDQLVPDQDLFESRFLPPEMSSSIRVIISTTGAVRVDPTALSGFSYRRILLEPPGEQELEKILHSRFAAEHKQISPKVAGKLLENPCSRNMLGMEIMVRRLVMLGQKDFDEITRLEQTMGGAEAIDTYLVGLIEKFPAELNKLIIDYFFDVSRFLDDGDYTRTALLLYLIGIMQHGIAAHELEAYSHCLHTDETYRMIPADHPWMHFWDPVSFARLKRYMGGLLVERSNGNIDLSHRLLRQALRSGKSFEIIAPVLRCWVCQLDEGNDQRLENILPLSRLTEQSEYHNRKDGEYTPRRDQIDYFISGPIRTAGNLYDDGDPEGKRQLEVLERSVIQDITQEDQDEVAATYCRILGYLIREGASANHYTVWFFGTRIAISLSRLGQKEKACAIRLMSCILSQLHKQKAAFEAGEERYRDNWSVRQKRRFLYFHCHTLQKMADLMMDFRLGNVAVRYYDGMEPKVIFEKGCALADECIREEPSYAVCYLRKAALYAAYAKQTSEGANFGFTRSKQQKYTQEAFRCIEQALRLDATDFNREYALCIMAICMESVNLEGGGRIFGSKNALEYGIAMCGKTWELATAGADVKKLAVDCVARFILAWSRCLDARGEAIFCFDAKPWRQKSLELCAQYYLDIRGQQERSLSGADRKYLGLVGVQACLMMMHGVTSEVMTDAGYSFNKALRYITRWEAGYFRAEARGDFESRWCWALMLCAEACAGVLKPQAGVDGMNRAVTLLEELYEAADKKGYALDVSAARIDTFLDFAKKQRDKYGEKAKDSGR